MNSHKNPTSMRLSDEALRLIKEIAKRLGISEAAVLEIIIRQYAKQEKIDL